MPKELPQHIMGLHAYLSQDSERNEDLALTYFRHIYKDKFKRQSDQEARGADGYVPGHFVLELKGDANDWYAALFQGLAYQAKGLAFSLIIVAAKHFLAIWQVEDIPSDIRNEVLSDKAAPNVVGKRYAKKFASKKTALLRKVSWHRPEMFEPLFAEKKDSFIGAIKTFEKTIEERKKVRQPINIKNFTNILKEMKQFFDPEQPIKVVRAFYSMIYGPWDEVSTLNISQRHDDRATIGSAEIANLIPTKRGKFKEFIENHCIQLNNSENLDDFFAKYDEALDAVDKNFRIKNGIFFTDLDLAKLVMWFIKQKIPRLGRNYLVIDPACGSGNLVTNWRSPLELRHKVVSEIEPELLFAVEQRMKGDQWHQGKFTVVPKVSENKGLNFLDKSAKGYLDILKEHLAEKGLKPDKPIAFLCNPPYRSDDDQTAEAINYKIDNEVINMVGKDAASDRYLCFLAQMKLICENAANSGLPENSLLLLFTQTSWLTQRPLVQKIRNEMLSSFEDIGGILINGAEFFDGIGKFPIAFTIWKYNGKNTSLNPERPIELVDLCHLKKKDLSIINWDNPKQLNEQCEQILQQGAKQSLGIIRTKFSGRWAGSTRRNLYRNLSKEECADKSVTHLGLPKGDPRHAMKTTFGYSKGTDISFMLNLTPCRTILKEEEKNKIWFHLDSRFMMTRTARCMSGIPDRGYCALNPEIAFNLFLWFSMCRTFGTIGYPMWTNMEEMWVPNISEKNKEQISKYIYSIAFAENDCIQVMFPTNNPVKGAPEIISSNQMSPLDKDSYWNKNISHIFSKKSENIADHTVNTVNKIFDIWQTRFKYKKTVVPNYERNYFISSNATLGLGAGLVQIRDFAAENNDTELLKFFLILSENLKELKNEFYNFLVSKDGLSYFNQKPTAVFSLGARKEITKTKFDVALEKRRSLTGLLIDELKSDENLGTVKLAKILYIADYECDLKLDADYIRDVAGPVDARMLYNSKIGLFPHGKSSDLGKIIDSTFIKDGKKITFKKITPSKSTKEWATKSKALFGNQFTSIKNIINLFKPLTTDHSEAVATLYACWNDLIISNKNPTDDEIIKNFYAWGTKKKRFKKEDLIKTIGWMRSKNLLPKGRGKKTIIKHIADNEDVPY